MSAANPPNIAFRLSDTPLRISTTNPNTGTNAKKLLFVSTPSASKNAANNASRASPVFHQRTMNPRNAKDRGTISASLEMRDDM